MKTNFAAILSTLFVAVTAVSASAIPAEKRAASNLNTAIRTDARRYFGTATDQNTFSIPQVDNIIKSDFGCVTPENSMKVRLSPSLFPPFSLFLTSLSILYVAVGCN